MATKYEHSVACAILPLLESKPKKNSLDIFKANMLGILSELCKCLFFFAHALFMYSTIFSIIMQSFSQRLFYRLIHIHHPVATRGIQIVPAPFRENE